MPHNRTQTHRRKMAAQNKARTRPCKRCGETVYFQRCGVGFRAMNAVDNSVHACKTGRAERREKTTGLLDFVHLEYSDADKGATIAKSSALWPADGSHTTVEVNSTVIGTGRKSDATIRNP